MFAWLKKLLGFEEALPEKLSLASDLNPSDYKSPETTPLAPDLSPSKYVTQEVTCCEPQAWSQADTASPVAPEPAAANPVKTARKVAKKKSKKKTAKRKKSGELH